MYKSVFVTCHGMFAEEPGYSDAWMKALQKNKEIEFKEFYWETINNQKEKTFIKLLKSLSNILVGNKIASQIYTRVDELNDVVNYRSRKKKAIKEYQIFLEDLIKGGYTVTILAHSLGSVLSYETVVQLSVKNQLKVKLVTFGSPLCKTWMRIYLGVKDVYTHLKEWYNFTGDKDPITMFGTPIENFSNIRRSHNVLTHNSHDPVQYLKNMKFYNILLD